MYLGLEEQTGLVYEGSANAEIPTIPLPAVLQAKLIEKPEDWQRLPGGIATDPFQWTFREDSFDPVTRVRRGRLYQPWGSSQPSDQQVLPHPYDDPLRRAQSNYGRMPKRLNVYATCSELLNKPRRGEGLTLALGTREAASAWLILSTEVLANRAVMVTLKAMSAFGALPALDEAKVPQAFRPAVRQSFEKVLDSAFRESPSSVVEHCRDALQVFVSRWLVARGSDEAVKKAELAPIAKVVEKDPYDLVCVGQLARVVARLHGGRGKTNEREDKGARELTDEDAELSVRAVGFVLRDLGWARG
jgi:hypothetical protein